MVTDALSRRCPTTAEIKEAKNEQDIDEWVLSRLFAAKVRPTVKVRPARALIDDEEDEMISQPRARKSDNVKSG